MRQKDRKGEGNPDSDRRYREGVSDTVEETTESQRSEKARDLSREELEEARRAEEEGKSHRKK